MTILKELSDIEAEAEQFGFCWPDAKMILDQIASESAEIKHALEKETPERLQEEIGDLIFAAFSLAVFLKFDPEETLAKSLHKFRKRFQKMKTIAAQEGHTSLQGKSLETLLRFWKQAKTCDKN